MTPIFSVNMSDRRSNLILIEPNDVPISIACQLDWLTGTVESIYSNLCAAGGSNAGMVRILSVYHFSGEMVDTVDDLSSLTITNHNKLLVAQSDYSVQVKDLLSNEKTPIFVFPTIDLVQDIAHCAAGNYVATVEGKQTFQKSDILIVRIYTNWEPDSADYAISSKRYIRPRIAGMVTPSSAMGNANFLDMIEIPINFMSPTSITCCQRTGRLLIACGPTIHLFNQIYKRGNNISPAFMDFIALTEVFDLIFQPDSVVIYENVIAAHCSDKISVFHLKNVNDDGNGNLANSVQTSVSEKDDKTAVIDDALDLDRVLRSIDENKADELHATLSQLSFPVKVLLKGINDNSFTSKEHGLPFDTVNKSARNPFKNGKVLDNFIVTLSEQEPGVVAENLLALKMNDSEDTISNIALHILPDLCSSNRSRQSGSSQKVHFFFSTFQEGYLFFGSAQKGDLQCVAIFNFTARVCSIIFEACVLHVLTDSGLETYNLPTLRSIVLDEDVNLTNSPPNISIFGVKQFLGVLNFIRSDKLITIFSSASDEKKGKQSLPWTMYSLKIPSIYDVYREMINLSREFHSGDEYSYKYLLLESFLILQAAFSLQLPMNTLDDEDSVRKIHERDAIELADLCFKSENMCDVRTGFAVILACGADPLEFIRNFNFKDKNVAKETSVLLKEWLKRDQVSLKERDYEFLIKLLGESEELADFAEFLLSKEEICRLVGHKALQVLSSRLASSYHDRIDVKILLVLSILRTQMNQQTEIIDRLKDVSSDEEYQRSFALVILKHWNFLFDQTSKTVKNVPNFSELTYSLVEYAPLVISRVLSELVISGEFAMVDVVQSLLKLFPCHVSLQKGHLVIQTLLETIFSSNTIVDFDDVNICNCAKILLRSYLSQLFIEGREKSVSPYRPIFVDELPNYVAQLPIPEKVSVFILRRLQEMIFRKMVDRGFVEEVVDGLDDSKLKLNFLAMLNNFDFIEELIRRNFLDVILPYAKFSFHATKDWQDLFRLVLQHRLCAHEDSDERVLVYEEVLCRILDHLAHTMSAAQVCAIISDSTIPHRDELHRKYVLIAERIAYANDVKALIVNTSQQLLKSNPS